MKNKTYNIQNTLKSLEKYNEMNLLIQSETKDFDITFANKYNPHLLGLSYITERKDMNGMKLYNYIFENNLSDQEILNRIEKSHGKVMKENVVNRIKTFPNFLRNLENGIIVEKTLATKMNVNYLIIQNKDNNFYHLGILSGSNGALLVDFDNIDDKREKDFLKTYFVEPNNEYFKNSNIVELVRSIERYDEKEKIYVPFSFDEEKNKKLLEEFYIKKKANYNCLTGEPINIGVHSSGESKWLAKKDVEKYRIEKLDGAKEVIGHITYIENNKLHQKSVIYYNVSDLKITKEIEQKFVPMKKKEKTQEIEKSRGQGIGD